MIQYPFALDENGVLTAIESVDVAHRHDHSYRCPKCGREMRPRLGEKRTKHFYHSDNHECSAESYIHYVGKRLLYDRFYSEKPMIVEYERPVKCELWNQCTLRGWDYSICMLPPEKVTFDLKEYYDTAALEKEWSGFRPDVLLSNSVDPSRLPFFLEVCFRHPCTLEKRNSGFQILEIRLNDVAELRRLKDDDVITGGVSYNLKEGSCGRDRLFAAHKYKSRFPCAVEYQPELAPFIRVSFYQSGETSQKKVFSMSDAHDENALFEITHDARWSKHRFSAVEMISVKNSLYRNCLCCFQCLDKTKKAYCNQGLNGSLITGLIDKFRARTCDSYYPSGSYPYCQGYFGDVYEDGGVDYESFYAGQDYDLWLNPRFPETLYPDVQ